MKSRRQTNRSFPGRLTLNEWLELPYLVRLDLAWRAQCELLNCHRLCAHKQCQRHRTCCGDDAMACERRLWQIPKTRPKTLRRESGRLTDLAKLRGPDRVPPWEQAASHEIRYGVRSSGALPGRRGSDSSAGRAASRPVRAKKQNSDAGLWEIIQTGKEG
jgi:hypothetical protein